MERIYQTPFYRKFLDPLFAIFSDIQWERPKELLTGRRFNLSEKDKDYVARLLALDNYVILTRKNSHLTTYLIALGDWIKRPRWGVGHYPHCVVHTKRADTKEGLEFVEAVKGGVKRSTFEEIIKCDSIALLKAKNYTREELRLHSVEFVAEAHENVGKLYDNALKAQDQSHMSCVEVGRDSLRQLPEYDDRMARFEAEIWKRRALTPQMFYDSPDFEVVFEIRR